MDKNYTYNFYGKLLQRLMLTAAFSLLFQSAFSQVSSSYSFTNSLGTYSNLTSPTYLTGPGSTDDDTNWPLAPIGFTFNYNGQSFTTFGASSNGDIALGATTVLLPRESPLSSNINCISAFGQDLQGKGATNSGISYQVIGTSPNRTCIIQYRDWTRYLNSSYPLDTLNFQIHLNENGPVRIVYGPCVLNSSGVGPWPVQVGITGSSLTDFNLRQGTTFASGGTAGTTNLQAMQAGTTNTPDNGRTFTWQQSPMSYDSTLTFQISAAVPQGATNQHILNVKVYTQGGINPLSATSFTFNTNGTTVPANILNAKLFYTGTSTAFAPVNQFGITKANPNGTFTFTGSTLLATGANNFWLAYDISPTAPNGNLLDGECTSVTVAGTPSVPLVTAPAGARQVSAPLSGNYTVGATGDFTTITNAITSANALGISNSVTFTLIDNLYSKATGEIFPIILNKVPGTSPSKTITIKPAATTTPVIVDSNSNALFIFDGAKYIGIDGRQSAIDINKNITIENLMLNGTAMNVKFINDANTCILRNTVVRSANNAFNYNSNGAAVYIGGTINPNLAGNDSITITNNIITRSRNNPFGAAICSYGQSAIALNENITIDSNWIYGYIGYPGSSYASGISVNSIGNGSNFKIRGNSFYDTMAVNNGQSSYAYSMAVYFVPGALSNGDTISGNYIGGNAPLALEGTRINYGTTVYVYHYGIYTSVGAGSGVVLADNVVRGINYPASTYYMYFYPYYIVGGKAQIGYAGHGNLLGSLNDTNSIMLMGTGYTYGFYGSGSSDLTMANNTISNFTMSTGSNYMYGYMLQSSNATGIVTNNRIKNVNLQGTNTGTSYLIYVGGSNQNQIISNNVIGGPNLADSIYIAPTATTGRFYGMYIVGGTNNTTTNNKIQNMFCYNTSNSGGTSASLIGMYSSVPNIITGNRFNNFRSYGVGTTGLTGMYIAGGANVVLSQDTVSNLTASSTYTSTGATAAINGIDVSASCALLNINNCQVFNLNNDQTTGYQVNGIYCLNSSTSGQTFINNNTVYNLRSNGNVYASGGIVGINNGAASSYPNQVMSGNVIHSLKSYNIAAGTPSVIGMIANASTALVANNSYITKNYIHSFNIGATSSNATMYGIWVNSGSALYANNMIRLGRDTSGAQIGVSTIIKGIYQSASGALQNRYLHNNVLIDAAPLAGPTSQITSAFELPTAPTAPGFADVRNNIFVNNTTNSLGTSLGFHYVVRYPTNPTNYNPIPNMTANFNLLSCQSSTNVFTGQVGTNNRTLLSDLQGAALLDGSSGFDNSLAFVNSTGNYTTVNLNIATSNKAEASGDSTALLFVTDDFSGAARSGLTPTDIGATGGNFTFTSDVIAPAIRFTNLANTSSTTDRTLSANIFDKGGVPLGTDRPRIYFKKMAVGTWFSNPGTLASGNRFNGNWNFTISNSTLGGVAAGDSVYYFIVAQDSTAGNLNANAMYASGSVNSLITFPALANSYYVSAAFPSTVTVGPGGTYTSFTENTATGFFNAMNSGSLTGNITALITGNITETGAVQLNPWVESGAGNYTLTIRPQFNTQVIVSGTVANANGLIRINGANRVNILGYSPTGTSADTNLVIRASSTSTPALGLLSGTGTDTIANVILESRVSSSAAGVIFISATPLPTIATTGVNNVLFNGCYIRQDLTLPGSSFPYNGFYSIGTVPRFNNNIWIKNCNFSNYTYAGINVATTGNGNGWQISGNNFYHNALATWTYTMYGIYFTPASTSDNNIINGNWIGGTAPFNSGTSLQLTTTFYGIYAQAGIAGGTIINNNKISNITFTAANTAANYGIYVLGTASTYTVNGNRFGNDIPALSINSAGNHRVVGFYSSATGNVTFQNDTAINFTNTNAGGATVGFTGINVVSGSANTTLINSNYIRGIIVNSANTGYVYNQAGSITGIFLGSTSLNQTISNNTVRTLINTNSGSANQVVGIGQYSGGAVNILNNTIYGIYSRSTNTLLNTYQSAIEGIMVYSSTSYPQTFSGNIIDSIWHIPATAAATQVVGIFNYYFSAIPVIMTNNIIRNINSFSSNTGTTYNAAILGISMYFGYGTINGNFSNNKIYNLHALHTTAANSVVGLFYSGQASIVGNNSVVNANQIHSFRSASNSASTRFDGIIVYAGNTTFTNNMIRLGIDSAGLVTTSPTVMNGIFSQAAYQNNFYNNTILVAGSPSTGAAQTTAFYNSVQIPAGFVFNIKNNIFVNTVNNGGTATGKNYGLRIMDSLRTVSNYNLFNVTGTGGLAAGTNYADYAQLQGAVYSWKSGTGLDMMSGSGDPNFTSNASGISETFNLDVQATNPIEKSGDPTLTSVLTDFYGNTRSSNSPSDIGASSGNFTQSPDLFPPMITFTPLTPSGTLSGTRVLSGVTITDNNGIPMSGANRPKVYYSKDGITWYNTSATTLTGTAFNATASFGIDYTPMMPLSVNDTIRYYILAQDIAGNTISNAPYAVAAGVGSVSNHPINPNKYNFLPVIAANTVFSVGNGQTYTTLTGAGGFFEFINSRTLGGSITAEITSDLSEPGTVSLNQFGEDGAGAGTYSLTIRPSAATSSVLTIQGNVSGNGMIRLDGTNRVKINGVPTGGASNLKYLLFRNQANNAPAVSLMNGAYGNRLNNIIVENGNLNTAGAAGAVNILTIAGTVPCTFDTISNCIVRNDPTAIAPAGLPMFAIYTNGAATGTGVFNNNCIITGNEVANFNNSGIVMDLNNSNNWIISNNSIYCNLAFTPPTATQLVGINLVPNGNGSGIVISGNFIGGSAANCGGTPWTNASPSTTFIPIRMSVGQGANTLVQNNTIKNINFTASGSNQFIGIYGLGGNIVIGGGVGLGNTIGDPLTTNSIRFGNATTHYGILYSGTNNSTVSYNTVAGMTMGTLGYSGSFYCISVQAGNCLGINNNTVGSTTVTNSIVNNGYTQLFGIYPTLPANYTLGTYSVSNNTIANLYSAANNFSSTSLAGLYIAGTANVLINNNTVFNLSSNSINNAFSGLGVIQGIQSSIGSQTIATISNNTVYGLRALNTSAVNTCVYGIICAAGQSPVVTGNRVYDLNNASTSISTIGNVPVIGGIVFAGSPQINTTVANNQITLGAGTSTNTQIDGLWLQYGNTGFTMNAYNNTVYITGTNLAGGNQNSYAFARSNNSGGEMGTFLNLRNNIFANNRTGGSGVHCAIANYTNAPTNNYWSLGTSQYNLLASGNAATLAQWGNATVTFSNWQTLSTSDNMSYSMTLGTGAGQLNPANLFTAAASGNLTVNAANIESWYVYGKGIAGAQVNNLNTDFSGLSRGTTQGYAITIGATQLNSVPSMLPPAATASAAPAANTTTSYTFAGRNVASINWGATAPTSATVYNFTGVTPSNQPTGNNMNQYVRVDLGAAGTFPYGATLNYDIAMTGAVTSGSNLKLSTATSSSTPVWVTNPVSNVNTITQTATALGMTTTTNTIMLTGTENNVAPTVLSFLPAARQVGGTVTIYGRSFVTLPATSVVSFNGTAAASFVVVNDTTITTTVPVGATTGPVSVTNAYGTGASATNFIVIQAPTVTSFTPITGTIGSTVTITGTNFTYATQVQVNTTTVVSPVIVNNTTITAVIPSGATTGNISVTNPAGTGNSSLFGVYTVIQAPTITLFAPTSGAAGTLVTLTGTNFTGVTAVALNGTPASYTVNSSTSITLTVPNGATTGTITVTNGSGTGTSGTNFTVVQLPTITGFTPSTGGIGTTVIINGTNFTGATAVAFNGTPSVGFVVNTSTQITATVPAAATTGQISVTTPAGIANSGSNFTVIPDLTISTTTVAQGTYNNVTITSTGNASLIGNLVVMGNMVVNTGGKLNTNGFTVSGSNNFTLNSGATLTITSPLGISSTGGVTGDIQVSGTRSFNASASYVYGGASAQITGNGLPAAVDTLVINNLNGVSLTQTTTVNNRLTLTSGNLSLGSRNLTIGAAGNFTGGSATSYIATTGTGTLNRTVANNATNVVFPVGTSTAYAPAAIQQTVAATTDVFSVAVGNGVLSNGTSGTTIANNAVNSTWSISEAVAGGSNATVALTWDISNELLSFARNNCAVAYYNTTLNSWTALGYGAATGTNPYSRSRSGVTSFGLFAVGDNSGILPVELISFTGVQMGSDVVLKWSTASEINSSHFVVERSLDGNTFEKVGEIKGNGNTTKTSNYSLVDAGIAKTAGTIYYRLKQVDFDGISEYVGNVVINTNSNMDEVNMNVYPNPFKNQVEVDFNNVNDGTAQVIIVDIQGRVVKSMELNVSKGFRTYQISGLDELNNGVYFMNVTIGGLTKQQKLVKNGN